MRISVNIQPISFTKVLRTRALSYTQLAKLNIEHFYRNTGIHIEILGWYIIT